MDTATMVVLSELRILRSRYSELVNDHSYCTTETERFEKAFDRLIKAVEQDGPDND